ncbi:hypothetical protein L1987_29165 [Smallanthus sonchifolius]|uniref:Uncharacterized protein n=1 Tax=Smallanthus sonchifolius TaxID=185202 RepID=A0ACB9HZA0_9ASTR|nr:hypothetical protein L1987_29165 [Smallanthus sonchifolius]
MDASYTPHQSSDSSPESSLSQDKRIFRQDSLPFNLNDSEDMMLLDMLAFAAMVDLDQPSELNSPTATAVKDGEVSSDSKSSTNNKSYRGESLKKMKYCFEEGCSPVVVLKKRHCQRSKRKDNFAGGEKKTVVLEDLGADYLEQLLNLSENGTCAS